MPTIVAGSIPHLMLEQASASALFFFWLRHGSKMILKQLGNGLQMWQNRMAKAVQVDYSTEISRLLHSCGNQPRESPCITPFCPYAFSRLARAFVGSAASSFDSLGSCRDPRRAAPGGQGMRSLDVERPVFADL